MKKPERITAPVEAPKFNMAHVYVNRLQRRWFGGKEYGPTVESVILSKPLPGDTDAAIETALGLLADAIELAPNASAKTRRRWAKRMGARLESAGHVPPLAS